jgi:hypothetical protein
MVSANALDVSLKDGSKTLLAAIEENLAAKAEPTTPPVADSAFLSTAICDEVVAYGESLGYGANHYDNPPDGYIMVFNHTTKGGVDVKVNMVLWPGNGYWNCSVYTNWGVDLPEKYKLYSIDEMKQMLDQCAKM